MVAFADLVLPDTTYLERWDCISLLDRSVGTAEGPADAIRRPVPKPDRDIAGAALTCGAALIATAGVLVERWLFFAEATHTVALYYGGGATSAAS